MNEFEKTNAKLAAMPYDINHPLYIVAGYVHNDARAKSIAANFLEPVEHQKQIKAWYIASSVALIALMFLAYCLKSTPVLFMGYSLNLVLIGIGFLCTAIILLSMISYSKRTRFYVCTLLLYNGQTEEKKETIYNNYLNALGGK